MADPDLVGILMLCVFFVAGFGSWLCFVFQEAKQPGQQMLRWGLFGIFFLVVFKFAVLPDQVATACLKELKAIAHSKESAQ